MTRRHVTYFAVRAVAATVFVFAATVLPRGVPAALVIMAAGAVAVFSSLWTNAGGPGEQAGARPQQRWLDSLRPPQGDWPPYGAEATSRTPGAS